jgi:hypothetical protein
VTLAALKVGSTVGALAVKLGVISAAWKVDSKVDQTVEMSVEYLDERWVDD